MTLSTTKQNILTAAIQIRDEGPILIDSGICCNLEKILFPRIEEHGQTISVIGLENFLEATFKLWPKYSGEEVYPVPSPLEGKTARQMYWSQGCDFWAGEYGQLRLELLDFLIETLVEEDRKA